MEQSAHILIWIKIDSKFTDEKQIGQDALNPVFST